MPSQKRYCSVRPAESGHSYVDASNLINNLNGIMKICSILGIYYFNRVMAISIKENSQGLIQKGVWTFPASRELYNSSLAETKFW